MIPRFLEREKEGGGLESKLYNIQIPQSNGGDGVHASSKDRNHNKVKDNGYDSRKVTISNIAGEVKYKKACLPQPRPSSTVVSSSTEVNNDEETEEDSTTIIADQITSINSQDASPIVEAEEESQQNVSVSILNNF